MTSLPVLPLHFLFEHITLAHLKYRFLWVHWYLRSSRHPSNCFQMVDFEFFFQKVILKVSIIKIISHGGIKQNLLF